MSSAQQALIQTAKSYVEVGRRLFQDNCLEEALLSLYKALDFKADYVEAHLLLGHIHAKQQRWKDCIHDYRHVIQLAPQNTQVYVSLADALRNEGRWKDAIQVCRQAEKQNRISPSIYRVLGNIMERRGRLDNAIRCYREFLSLNPSAQQGYLFLARSLQKNNQFRAVNQCCDRAMTYDSFIPEILRFKAKALVEMGQVVEAIVFYRRYLKIKPDMSSVYVELGDALFKQKRFNEVIDCCQQAKQQQKVEPGVYRLLATVFQRQGQMDKAIANYRKFSQLKPDAAWVYAALGRVLQDTGQLDKAVDCFQEAERRGHAQQLMNQLIADIYKKQDRSDEAVPFYEKVLMFQSGDLSIQGGQNLKKNAMVI